MELHHTFRTGEHRTACTTGGATMPEKLRRYLCLLLVALTGIPAGCALLQDRTAGAIRLAGAHGFNTEVVSTAYFKLRVFHRELSADSGHLRVYIEGDGSAWRRKHRLSRDPTPSDPVGLKLAVRDPGESVLYIARPCQFLGKKELINCAPIYWSTHRYSKEVMEAVNEVIETKAGQFDSISLIGFSGGGSVAALVAAGRDDVAWLMTVAANLDHRAWTKLHQVTPLHGSLNAIDYVDLLKDIPQTHLAGADDDNVPVRLLKGYQDAAGSPPAMEIVEIEDYDHTCCWATNWRKLICTYNPASIAACSTGASR